MKNQQTFNNDPVNQSGKNQEDIPEGTGRFSDDNYPLNQQKQHKQSQYAQQQNDDLLVTQLTKSQSQPTQSQKKGDPVHQQQQQQQQKPQQQSTQQKQKQHKGIRNQQISQVHCSEHQDREAEFVCVKIGCMRGSPLLCIECADVHQCENIPYSQFVGTMNNKFDRLMSKKHIISVDAQTFKDLDVKKQNLTKDIQNFFQQMSHQMSDQLHQLEPSLLKKIIVDDHKKLELNGNYLQSVLKTDLRELNKKRDLQQLTTDEIAVVKLVYNEFLSMADLKHLFLQDEDNLYRRLKDAKQNIYTLTNNFMMHVEELLNGEIRHISEDQFVLHNATQTTQTIKKEIEALLTNIKDVRTLNVHKGEHIIDFCHISQTLVASASDKGDIIVWKVPNFTEVFQFQHGIECTSLAFCQDEIKQKFLISAGRTTQEYQIYLWNIDLRTKVVEVTGHNHPLRKVVPLPRQRLAWCAQDHIVRVWNLKERSQENEIKNHTAWINDLCRLSDVLMASCSRDQTVAVFNYETGRVKYQLKEETYVNCLCAVSSQMFAFGLYNGSIKIYQNEFPVQIYSFRLNSNWLDSNCIWSIYRIADSFVAVSSANGNINLLNLDNHKNPSLYEIEISLSKTNEAMLWLPSFKKLLVSQRSLVKIFQ